MKVWWQAVFFSLKSPLFPSNTSINEINLCKKPHGKKEPPYGPVIGAFGRRSLSEPRAPRGRWARKEGPAKQRESGMRNSRRVYSGLGCIRESLDGDWCPRSSCMKSGWAAVVASLRELVWKYPGHVAWACPGMPQHRLLPWPLVSTISTVSIMRLSYININNNNTVDLDFLVGGQVGRLPLMQGQVWSTGWMISICCGTAIPCGSSMGLSLESKCCNHRESSGVGGLRYQ